MGAASLVEEAAHMKSKGFSRTMAVARATILLSSLAIVISGQGGGKPVAIDNDTSAAS